MKFSTNWLYLKKISRSEPFRKCHPPYQGILFTQETPWSTAFAPWPVPADLLTRHVKRQDMTNRIDHATTADQPGMVQSANAVDHGIFRVNNTPRWVVFPKRVRSWMFSDWGQLVLNFITKAKTVILASCLHAKKEHIPRLQNYGGIFPCRNRRYWRKFLEDNKV